MKLIKFRNIFLISLFLLFAKANANIMAVEDAAMLLKLVEQIKIMEKQYEKIEKSYESMTKQNNFGSLFHDSNDHTTPHTFKEDYQRIQTLGYGGLTPNARALYERNKIIDACKNIPALDEKKLCESRAAKIYQDQAYAFESLEKSKARMGKIEALMKKVDATKDPKAVAELQARIAAEQTLISNEQTQLELLKRSMEAEDRMIEDRMNQLNLREAQKTGTIDFDVMEFE